MGGASTHKIVIVVSDLLHNNIYYHNFYFLSINLLSYVKFLDTPSNQPFFLC